MSYYSTLSLRLLLLSFISGLPLALTASTLAAWLSDAGIAIASIGLFSLVANPYSLKFVWSPFLDSFGLPVLTQQMGRRRGWLLLIVLLLAGCLMLLAYSDPGQHILVTAGLAILVAFCSASYDIVFDAYRVEIVEPDQQSKGVAVTQLGYRLGMIASSAGALFLSSYLGWKTTYLVMGTIVAVIGTATLIGAKEPSIRQSTLPPKAEGWQRFTQPFLDFTQMKGWGLVIAFILSYKCADAFIGTLSNPFLLNIGFTKNDIAEIVKLYGIIATLAGAFMGGVLVARYGTVKIMFIAGGLHAITNLLYMMQADIGADKVFLAFSVVVENLSGGISSAAFVAFLGNLCSRHYTATQYALLSSLSAMGRNVLAAPAGFLVELVGWHWFFAFAATLAIPALLMLWILEKRFLLLKQGG